MIIRKYRGTLNFDKTIDDNNLERKSRGRDLVYV